MNEKKIVPIFKDRKHVIISGSGLFGVAHIESVDFEPYNRTASVDEESLLYRIIGGINRWYGKYGFDSYSVRRVLRAIEAMEHTMVRVYWSKKYLVPLVIHTVSYFDGADYAWLVVPNLEKLGDPNE